MLLCFARIMIRPTRQSLREIHLEKICWSVEHGSWELCRVLGAWLGLFNFAARQHLYGSAIANLRLALPGLGKNEARGIIRRSVQNSEMVFFETLRMGNTSSQEVRDYVSLGGLDLLGREHRKGRGVIVATAHLGNFEIAGARLAQEFPVTSTSLFVDTPKIAQTLTQVRRTAGVEVLPLAHSASGIREALAQGRVVVLFADQNGREKDWPMPFLGRTKRVVTSPACLACLSGASLMTCFAVRRSPWLSGGRFDLDFRPALTDTTSTRSCREEQVALGTERFVCELETVLRRHPDQWHTWMWSQLQ